MLKFMVGSYLALLVMVRLWRLRGVRVVPFHAWTADCWLIGNTLVSIESHPPFVAFKRYSQEGADRIIKEAKRAGLMTD